MFSFAVIVYDALLLHPMSALAAAAATDGGRPSEGRKPRLLTYAAGTAAAADLMKLQPHWRNAPCRITGVVSCDSTWIIVAGQYIKFPSPKCNGRTRTGLHHRTVFRNAGLGLCHSPSLGKLAS